MPMGNECAKCLQYEGLWLCFGFSGHENWTVSIVEFSSPIVQSYVMHPKYLFIIACALRMEVQIARLLRLILVTRVHTAISRFLIWPVRATDE